MKISALLFLFCLSASTIFAQYRPAMADLEIGDEIKVNGSITMEHVIGKDAGGYYVWQRNNNWNYLMQFDNNLKYKRKAKINMGKGYFKDEIEFFTTFNDQMYLFSSENDGKNKRNKLKARRINTKDLSIDYDGIVVQDMPYRNRVNDGFFDFETSRDSSRLLVYNNLPYKAGEAERFGFTVFKDDMDMVWTQDVSLPYTDRMFQVQDYLVSNQGDAYLLGRVFPDGSLRTRKGGKPNYEFRILSYTNSGQDMKEYSIRLKDKFITDMSFEVRNNGDMVCAGFYSDRGTYGIKGTFYMIVDAITGEIKGEVYEPFEIEFLSTFMGANRAEKERAELLEYDLNKLLLRRDGGVVLIGEQFFIEDRDNITNYGSRRNTMWGQTNSTTYFNYNDIIVSSINPNGKREWISKIAKHQASAEDGGFYSSYQYSIADGKLYFIYNDNPRNMGVTDSRKLVNFTGNNNSVVILASINSKGEMKKEALFNVKEAKMITRPKICRQLSWDETIIVGQRRRSQKLARLNFGKN